MNEKAKFLNINKDQQDRIDVVRNSFSNMYDVIAINCNSNRVETDEALFRLQEAQFWAIKGITREEEK